MIPESTPPPKKGCSDLIDQTYGFNVVDDNGLQLDVNTSFYRLICFERGLPAFRIAVGVAIITQFSALIAEWTDSQVDKNWFLLGQNHVSLGVLFYLFLTMMNTCVYRNEPGAVPFSVKLQWMLHVALLPGTSVAAIAYWRLLHGSAHDSGVQASKATGLAIMIFFGIFGLYETQWKHLLFSTSILYFHILYVLIFAMLGNFIYSSILSLNAVDLLIYGVEYTVYNVLIHTGYILIHQYNVYRRQGGTLWKSNRPSAPTV